MRRAWLTTVAAALCVAATSSRPAAAGLFGGAESTTESTSDSWTDSLKFWQSDSQPQGTAQAPKSKSPSAEISPWKHPISYMSATIAETPVAESLNRHKSERSIPQNHDSISLNTPTGPATPQYFISLAQLAERQGNVAEARRQLQQALAQWPNDVEILRAAARMEDRQGQLPLAEMLYQRAVAANPQHAGALNDLGLCLARQGKLPQSVQAMEQAIHLQPVKALYRNNVATVLVEMHQDQRALAHLSAVHGPADSNYNLGQLLVDRGRPHEAVMYFQAALDLDPSMEAARLAIAQLHGTVSSPAQVVVESPTVQPREATPSYDQRYAPQQPAAEPTFPSTARGPAFDTSSYVPPTRYYPANGMAPAPAYQTPVYQTATAPRYLPPVRPMVPGTTQSGTMVR